MSLINVREKTIQAKIVYYGTALSGKTTSLQKVHRVLDPEGRVELVSLNTEGDRTFFFDFLPVPLGTIHGYQLRIQAFTVPGQVKYGLTRRYVLRGADAVLFVADSSPGAFQDNVRSFEGLLENLRANGLDPERVPICFQYNKRDLPDAVPLDRLRDRLNPGRLAEFESVATSGEGVFEAFSEICAETTGRLAREYRVGDADEARAAVERRLRAAALTWRETAAPAVPTVQPVEEDGLATVDEVDENEISGVIAVSSADVPDLPDAETLLRHAVETNIESARLLSELTETRRRLADHVRHLAALHQTGVTLSSELDGDRLLDRVLASSLRTVDADRGSVLLFEEGGERLVERLVHGFTADPLAGAGEAEPEVAARILAGKPFVLELAAPPAGEDGAPAPAVALVAPLVHQQEALGALVAYVHDRPLDQDLRQRLRFLNAVALQAAVALVNARLYARIESFNRELERKVEERTSALARALEELKTLDRLKDDFLASMSHELLTPLQSIGSAGEILAAVADEAGPRAVEDRREFASVVQRESGRLTSLLRSVLDFSQLEAGKAVLRTQAVPLRDAVMASYRRHKADLRATRARLRLRIEDDMPPAAADPRWLGRVLDALLSNAVKFGRPGGEIRVTIRLVEGAARVEVRDQGAGVPDGLAGSIFEKFKQVGDVLTDKPAGLGLGLPTARLAVEAMGGRIWYAPSPRGGSVFSLELPAATSSPAPAEA